MRPRKLVLEGLRSYRSRQEIDFTGAGLMAIVGDTGAGKSSLLEALCVALYGGSTWDKRAVRQLLSSGAQTLSVELTFQADGKLWKVTRSTSRENYPPAMHKLECLSDGLQLDGAAPVNRKIQEIVGLSYEMFLRAVVLPQGKFQLLLQATGSERTSILKGIFRLEHLEAVRQEAEGHLDRLRPKLEELERTRGHLLEDPEATADEARRRRDELQERAKELEGIQRACELARLTATEARNRLAILSTALEEATPTAEIEAARDHLETLGKIEEELAATRSSQEKEIERLRGALGSLQQQLEEAAARRLGLGDLRRAEQILRHQQEQLAYIDRKRAEIDQATRALEDERGQLGTLEQDHERTKQQLAQAEELLETSRDDVTKTRAALEEAERALAAARQSRERLEQERNLTTSLEAELATLDGQLAVARKELSSAGAAVTEAERQLAARQRANAAAHAARGKVPGDPCPICERPLQEDWKPPAAAELREAEQKVEQARPARDEREQQTRQLEQQRAGAQARLDSQRTASVKAASAFEENLGSLRTLGLRCNSGEDLSEGLLAPLGERVRNAAQQLEERKGRHQTRLEAERQARQRLDQARTKIETTEERLVNERRELDVLASSVRKAVAELPEGLRPADPLERKGYPPAMAGIAERLRALEEIERKRGECGEALQQAQDCLEETRRSWQSNVEEPLRGHWRHLVQARNSYTSLAKAMGQPALEAPPDRSACAQLASYTEALAARSKALQRIAERTIDEQRAGLIQAETDLGQTLDRAGFPTESAVAPALVEAKSHLQTAQRDLTQAETQIPLAKDLDQRLATARPFLETLDELRRLLADGKFVGYVVTRKQQALLAVAGELLDQMTQQRYGFSEDFQVVDRLAGEARDVKTLSGGETFLASLSLALGLVELAGRSGGRLEALFLDEGFATLDANVLDEALDALHRQAEKGRLVAVISHLRSVAENIDRVLYVEKTPTGSRLTWLDPTARAVLVDEEGRLGLVS